MERTIKLDVVGIHLLCLGLTRGFNKNNLKNIPLKALYCVYGVPGYTQSTTYPGLSLRGMGLGFPLATLNIASGYFHRKIEAKYKQKKSPAV